MKDIKLLKKNGKISLVAPSFGCTTEPYETRLKEAIKFFKKEGYQVEEGENIFLDKGVMSSNTPKKRAEEFNKAYLESDSDIIISVGGGELMNEMLPYINFKKLKKAPGKLFVGFSDNTNLTFTLTTICEVPSLYGCNAPSFCYQPLEYSSLDGYRLIKGEINKTIGYPKWQKTKPEVEPEPCDLPICDETKIIKTYPKGEHFEMEGMLLGGNLDILSNLVGTKYDKVKKFINKYKDVGFIWYLEACDLNVLSIRRALFQLREAGWFKYTKGFLIGRPLCFGQKIGGVNQYNACKSVLKKFHVPVLMDVDLGHFYPSMPIFNGKIAKVIYKDKNIEIEYK
jgi:muramoyltetrapeptide carboxypeptidase